MGKKLVLCSLTMALVCVSTAQPATPLDGKTAEVKAANHAMGEGQYEEAAKRYCNASALDPQDHDLELLCRQTQRDMNKKLGQFDGFVADAIALADARRYDEAAAVFRRIKFGPNKAIADDWLKIKLSQLRAAAPPPTAGFPVPAASVHSDKADLVAAAARALNSGRLDDAARDYCAASALDGADSNLANLCYSSQLEVGKQLEKFEAYLSDGIARAGAHRYDDAATFFRRIKYGPNKAAADNWINTKLPQLKAREGAPKR